MMTQDQTISISRGRQGQGADEAVQAAPAATPGIEGVPSTAQEVQTLIGRRTELSSQLTSLESRARRLISDMSAAPTSEAQTSLAQRLKLTNEQIVQVQTDFAATNKLLAQAPQYLLRQYTYQSQPPRNDGLTADHITAISIVGILFVCTPLAIAYARILWRRAVRPRASVVQDADAAQRLTRMEQAVDSVAIEVERISEGQRFLTNLFARERQQAALSEAHAVRSPREGT